ncbi:MAG: DUF2138 domain-containing protein [Pseudomonas sp.]|uniref:DUF2138 domain-containing protein n=1 Tax=Pseudomonas sp. TaxID=306 RepID=UPI002716E6EB|nr:DUF2138 domain-containing protein [Pseudomonas sp.]MDO9618594.1 DUF2138 domain-containing protein [Pseudomonas sp.]MDP2444409.1 DUF2138 domain-containing protein [Pseudomonas sp.]MDZ4336568.1 DUF2138 domain-containing protein [Pseudomonas sp.]
MSDNTTPASASASVRRLRPLLIGLALAVPIVAAGLFGWFQAIRSGPELAEKNVLGLDMARPDVLIESSSLSRLPRDLLAVPLLRDTLTEDLVFYYEGNADRLGLAGSLRRIIFEHDLQLRDSLLDELLDQPADVAMWRDASGKLKHFLVRIQRGGLAKVLEPLAKVALDDQQLSQAGELLVNDEVVPFYSLRYNSHRSLLFVSYGDQLLLLSSADMLLAPESEYVASAVEIDEAPSVDAEAPMLEPASPALARVSAHTVAALLEGGQPFPERFGLPAREQLEQRITLASSFLALGYQRFIPAFAGVRFEMDAGGWRSYLALNEADDQPTLDFAPVWRAMPMGASACVALPVAGGVSERLLSKVGTEEAVAKALTAQLSGAAGLCWYAESRLHSPLLVGLLSAPPSAELDQQMGTLFGSLIGAWEANTAEGSFPVIAQSLGEQRTWRREVSSNFGPYPASDAQQPEAMAARGFFRVSMARHGSTLLFSLDDRLVDKALSTLDKRFPPLADVLPQNVLVPAYLAPDSLSALFEQETFDSLPADMEPVFRNAAQTLLLPKLKALAGHGKYALTLPAGSEAKEAWQWLPLEWRAL